MATPTLTTICDEYQKEVNGKSDIFWAIRDAIIKVYDTAIPPFIAKVNHMKNLHHAAVPVKKTIKTRILGRDKYSQLTQDIDVWSEVTITVLKNRKAIYLSNPASVHSDIELTQRCKEIVMTLLNDIALNDRRIRDDFELYDLATHDGLPSLVVFRVPDMVALVDKNEPDWKKKMIAIFSSSMKAACNRFDDEWQPMKNTILERVNQCRSHVEQEYGQIVMEGFNENVATLEGELVADVYCMAESVKHEEKLTEQFRTLTKFDIGSIMLESHGDAMKRYFEKDLKAVNKAIRYIEFEITGCE